MPRTPPLRQVGARAVEELAHLLGATAERVTELRKSDQGYSATIEVVEFQRVPETTDVLADYQVDLTPEGEVLGYRRTRRYLRVEAERE